MSCSTQSKPRPSPSLRETRWFPTRPHDSPSHQLQAGLRHSALCWGPSLETLLPLASGAGGLLHPGGHSVPSHSLLDAPAPAFTGAPGTPLFCIQRPRSRPFASVGFLPLGSRSTSLSWTAGLPGEPCGEPRVLPTFFRQGSPAHTQHPPALRPLPGVPRPPHSDAARPDRGDDCRSDHLPQSLHQTRPLLALPAEGQ